MIRDLRAEMCVRSRRLASFVKIRLFMRAGAGAGAWPVALMPELTLSKVYCSNTKKRTPSCGGCLSAWLDGRPRTAAGVGHVLAPLTGCSC